MNAPNRPKAFNKVRRIWLLDAMLKAGWRLSEVASHFDVSVDTIRAVRDRTGAYSDQPYFEAIDRNDEIGYASQLRVLRRRIERQRAHAKAEKRKEQAA